MTDDALNDNAAVLARMAKQGDDLTQAREVDFAHTFDDRRAAEAFCSWARRQGYVATVENREDASTDVIVRHRMVPDLQPLTELELSLAAAARDHAGEPDGWGCWAVPKLHS
jgi:hypothetical protein